MVTHTPTIHASAVLAGARAVLIRGGSGTGKSRLALAVLEAAQTGHLPFARLVSDDRTHLEAIHGRLLARPVAELAGLVEIRGLGIRRVLYEPVAVVSLVVDLADAEAERMPESANRRTVIEGISMQRLAVAPGVDPLPLVLTALTAPDPDR